jgi:HD superfamily phosphohydrolase
MQRLKGIKQLGLVDRVYPGANHTRFEHSIGTMHMAGRIAEALGLEHSDISLVRAAGLLHDLGHSAFSHAVEGVLGRNPEIQPVLSGKKASRHEEFTWDIIINHTFGEEAARAAEEAFGDADEFFRKVAEIALGGRLPYGQIISGDLDADRIDFLLRDSHHSGVGLGLIDADQIISALTISKGRVVLAGHGDYRSELSMTAAESMLIARAHHYNALIHNPMVQSVRAMMLSALEKALGGLDPEEAKSRILLFFREYTDSDLLRFIWLEGSDQSKELLGRIMSGREYTLAARFDHRSLPPCTRMALATISRNGRMRKIFEDGLGKKYSSLVDISTGSGVPRSTRTEEGFLYDESALAAGLVKSLTRQIALSFFSDQKFEVSLEDVLDRALRLLCFIREENYLPIDGLLILFYSLHRILCETFGDRILVPRIRNITWLYRTISQLKDVNEDLSGLYDYAFHSEYGFPYSERLFEDLQILVAMGMVYQDQREYGSKGRWFLRYEYMLTAEGFRYAEHFSNSYKREIEIVKAQLMLNKHNIPYDKVSILLDRYLMSA